MRSFNCRRQTRIATIEHEQQLSVARMRMVSGDQSVRDTALEAHCTDGRSLIDLTRLLRNLKQNMPSALTNAHFST